MQVIKLFNHKKRPIGLPEAPAMPEVEFPPETVASEVEINAEAIQQEKLVQAAQQGDLTAFNELVLCYQQKVYNLAYRLLGDREAAADAAQDTFIHAYRALNQYRGGSFKSWLLRIATNLCYDQLRAKARRPSTSLEAMLEEAEETGGAALGYMEDSRSDPQLHAMRHEVVQEVGLALQQLPYEQRLIVVLSDVQGLSYEEIVEVTNCSLGTVKSRLSRGRLKLREYLQKNRELSSGDMRP